MPETVLDQVLIDLKETATEHYPAAGELRNLRVVGHAPKPDHFIYDLCADFAGGVERVAVKVYRMGKNSTQAKAMAAQENSNLQFVHEMPARKKVDGIPRPLGDFTRLGAVVTAKIAGLPLQAMVMKAALLPGYAADNVAAAARRAGTWLRGFHKATAHPQQPLDSGALISQLEELCSRCRKQGLDEASAKMVLNAAQRVQSGIKKPLPHSAVLGEFTPLNVIISEDRVGFADLSRMQRQNVSLEDVALFVASVEALEKYPFCNREITREAQHSFLDAYGITPAESALLPVLKTKALLGMFAHGRPTGENGERKRVMWANIMRRFIRQAAERTLEPMAA
jgi:hypothetical protein